MNKIHKIVWYYINIQLYAKYKKYFSETKKGLMKYLIYVQFHFTLKYVLTYSSIIQRNDDYINMQPVIFISLCNIKYFIFTKAITRFKNFLLKFRINILRSVLTFFTCYNLCSETAVKM